MGLCGGGDELEVARTKDKQIANNLQKSVLSQKEIKLLLLGSGESGKSTLFSTFYFVLFLVSSSKLSLFGNCLYNLFDIFIVELQCHNHAD